MYIPVCAARSRAGFKSEVVLVAALFPYLDRLILFITVPTMKVDPPDRLTKSDAR